MPAQEPAPESSLQMRIASRVPIQELPADLRDSVRHVVEQPTLYSHGAVESFSGQPAMYSWLLDHPDRAVVAWRRLGARCTEITRLENGHFRWRDDHGSEIRWQTIHNTASLRIWYAVGTIRPGLLLPSIPVQMVVLLRHGNRADGPTRNVIYHQPDVFLKTDSKTAVIVTRLLGASAPRVAEQCLSQMEAFYSGLVWYMDHHPERTEKLLAINPAAAAPDWPVTR